MPAVPLYRRSSSEWPPQPASRIEDFSGTGITIYKEIFGALSQVPDSPLSRISVANSSFSLDPFVGCPAGCAYCVVGSSARDLETSRQVGDIVPREPHRLFAGQELVEALVAHPGFIPNKSVISIGTGSTESLLKQTERETWAIISSIAARGLRNPLWIVTKLGLPEDLKSLWVGRLKEVVSEGIPVIISITYSAAPEWMEPYKGPRFRGVAELRSVGVRVSHHYRPILRGINDGDEHIQRALEASKDLVEVICLGGLRPDPGIRLIWETVHGLDPGLLPRTEGKDLPEDFWKRVRAALDKSGSTLPIVDRSSEAISFLLGSDDYNLYRYRPADERVFLQLPLVVQAEIAGKTGRKVREIIAEVATKLGLPDVVAGTEGESIGLTRHLSYQEHRVLIHGLGHSGIFP